MLTKKQAADFIILSLSGGHPTPENKISRPVVYAALDNVLNEYIAKDVEEELNRKGSFNVDSTWVKTFSGKDAPIIQWDPHRAQCFALLPASRVGIEDDQDIRQVCWSQGASEDFPMEKPGSAKAWAHLEAGFVGDGRYPFYPDNDKIYWRTMPKRLAGSRIMVSMVAGANGYTEDEELPIPNSVAQTIFERLAQWFKMQAITKAKQSNDGNPNT